MSTETENNNTSIEEVKTELAGDLLRKKREKLGLSQKEIADRLRLRVSIIESIDANNYDFDQVATFTRGYLCSYAKAVSLDEKVVLAALNHANEVQHIEQEMQSFSRKTKRDKHDRRIMKLTWVIFAVIIGISSIWWYQNQQDTLTDSVDNEIVLDDKVNQEPASPVINREVVETQEVEPIETETLPSETLEPETKTKPEVTSEKSSIDVTEQPIFEQKTTDKQEIAQEVAAIVDENPVEAAVTELVMEFSSDCWVQVKDASGATLATGVKKAGRVINLVGQSPFSFILGAPEGVSLTLAGEPVDLSGHTSGKVARFTLP